MSAWGARKLVIVVVAAAAYATQPHAAAASCTVEAEQTAFKRAVFDTLRCASRRLRGSACVPPAAPACGAAEVARVLDLVGGMPSSAVPTSDPMRCQAEAYRGAARFLVRRIDERVRGVRRQRRSYSSIRIDQRCTVPITASPEGPLPRLGADCAALTAAPAGELDGVAARRCLRPALERIVADVLDLPPVAPNVVLVVTDDQHPEGINLMPDVAALAERGARFANAFTTTPLCAPSRAGILSGQHAPRHGVTGNSALGFDDESTLATWFQAAGYRTALLGKYLNGYNFLSPEIPPGWDEWRAFVNDGNNFFTYALNENGVVRDYGSAAADYSTDVLAGHAVRFLEGNAERPFFLFLAPFAPHAPSTPAPRHDGSLAWLPQWRPPGWFEDLTDKPQWFRFVAVNKMETMLANDAKVLDQRESLLSVDEAMRAVVAQLERLGLSDNTIVVFTADHGLLWGEHRWFGKQLPYEESIRIPLSITYPLRIAAGSVVQGAALNIDIAPTLTTLTGVAAGHDVDGRTLTDLLAGAPDWRTDFLVQHFTGGFLVPPWDMVRTGQHKFVRHPTAIDELYDLAADPHELDNGALLPANAALVASLEARLDELLN